jgi:hypothetical protein
LRILNQLLEHFLSKGHMIRTRRELGKSTSELNAGKVGMTIF